MIPRPNFMERMEAGKLVAAGYRARGLHTGKTAKGWNRKRPDVEVGTWARACEEARYGFRDALTQALADLDWHARLKYVVGECDEIPF